MSKTDELTKTYSGIFGNQVTLRNRRGKSVMTMPPARTINPASEKQKIVRERFRLAAGYARLAMENPELKAIYAARATKNMTTYRLAVQDFLSPPFIRQIDPSGYKRKPRRHHSGGSRRQLSGHPGNGDHPQR